MTIKCPECGSAEVYYDLTCHTWPQTGPNGKITWMHCLPCDSAVEYMCLENNCAWRYVHGLNPDNPRSKENEEKRPSWMIDLEYSEFGGQKVVQGISCL